MTDAKDRQEKSTSESSKTSLISSAFQVLLSTLAAFIGVQSDKNRQRDFQQKSILPFMLLGVVLAACFIMGLVLIARQLTP